MKKRKPDEYFNNGIIEMARYDNSVGVVNHANEDIQQQIIDGFAENYAILKNEIDELVLRIRSNVAIVDPENLMNYLASMNFFVMLNKKTESEFEARENYQLRAIEYIQSVLVSTDIKPNDNLSETELENIYGEILSDVCTLYEKMPIFYMHWMFKEQKYSNLDDETQEYIMLSQLMSQVRGTQYQIFRIDVLSALLIPHSENIQNVYGIGHDELINGLTNLEKNLSSGRLDALKTMCEQMDQLDSYENNAIPEDFLEEGRNTVLQVIGLDLFDVKKATGWPDILIDDLTYDIGEDDSFFTHDEFPGWPIWNLPVQLKPFIRINGTVYTFDYYNFFDNFYRSFQKAIVKRMNDGTNTWKETQTEASEETVGKVFTELLPGCVVHRGNYYPLSKHDSAENDLLIEYRDVLIIIEVKAGSFTYTPALTDFKAHQKSLKDLVEKAEKQCIRTKDYIISNEYAVFYSGNDLQVETFRVRKSDYSQIYMFDVTVDDFNEIAAQMEKVRIADTKTDIIAISLDDLWVYKEYFENPFQFVHFLKQRTMATRTREIITFDELDHLGLYIEHNMYSLQAQQVGSGFTNVFFDGYREALDLYFSQKWLGIYTEKPQQKLPEEFNRLLEICDTNKSKKVTHFTNFLLDMSSESKTNFCENIYKISKRESELGTMIPAIAFGELSYCLYIHKDGVKTVDPFNQREYVLATLAKNLNPYCYLITLYVDSDDQLLNVEYEYLTQQDIPAELRKELTEKGDFYAKRRAQSFLIQHHKKKIGRNEQCPCGSGKKYKKCCGR